MPAGTRKNTHLQGEVLSRAANEIRRRDLRPDRHESAALANPFDDARRFEIRRSIGYLSEVQARSDRIARDIERVHLDVVQRPNRDIEFVLALVQSQLHRDK